LCIFIQYVHQVKLTDALLSALEFKKIKDAEVAWLDSRIAQKEVEDLVHADDVVMSGELNLFVLMDRF